MMPMPIRIATPINVKMVPILCRIPIFQRAAMTMLPIPCPREQIIHRRKERLSVSETEAWHVVPAHRKCAQRGIPARQ